MATTVTTARAQWSPAPAAADATELWQHAVLDELRAIRAALEQRQRPLVPPSRADRAFLGKLLPVLAATYGSDGFTSRDCHEDDDPGLRLVLGPMSPKKIGKLLARAEDIAIDGLTLQRMGLEYQVTTWRIVAC